MKVIEGKIVSGVGDFSERMKGIVGLLDAYERKTGMRFFPGTLNIELAEEYSVPSEALRLDKNDYNGTVSVYIVPCKLFNRRAFILRTEKNEKEQGHHSKKIVEIACDVKLRDAYGLRDGDSVEITLE